MDILSETELIELVHKMASELKNHLGVYDKMLAEFVIAQRLESDTIETFTRKLEEYGGDCFPDSLVESIDRFVRTMHPSMKVKMRAPHDDPDKRFLAEKKAHMFPALTLPDEMPPQDSIDDTLKSLEALQPSHRHDHSRIRQRVRSHSRSRSRSRSRSCSCSRNRNRNRNRNRSRSPERMIQRCSKSRRRDETMYDERQVHGRRRHRGDDSTHHDGYEYARGSNRQPCVLDNEPVLHKVYAGRITGIKDFGAFVELDGLGRKTSGLVHVSQMTTGRVNHPSDLVDRGQHVKVRIISIQGTKIGLSMKDVSLDSDQDYALQAQFGSGTNTLPIGGRSSGEKFQNSVSAKRERKRLTSPERWEIRQLIASGVVKAADYPDLNEDYSMTLGGTDEIKLEEDLEVEVKHEEPPFLVGQTRQSLELSPIRVIKNPEGSLNRAAISGAARAHERRELQTENSEATNEQAKPDLSAQWNDPLADPNKRKFASDGRSKTGATGSDDIPEWKRVIKPKNQSYGRRVNMPIKQQRESLPVFTFRQHLINSVQQHQILVVVGETGSGKTTQLTQYLAEAGFANTGIIACTQPRRVAAMSVAKRVAEEVGCVLGEEVGYSVRFDDCTSSNTRIKYMTDGMLQREILQDPDLKRYSVIMLDEAHERTIATDVLFALLKKTLKKRSDLRVVVTSATLNAEKFSSYFNDAPIFTIPGRTFPVEVLYSREPESDYLDAALVTVLQIHLTEPAGDILLFLTGQEEIDTSCQILYERMKALGPSVPELLILPVYSALPTEIQSRIFDPSPNRKVIIATNIAETSITIDNIYYVIDPGFVKQKAYDSKLGMDSLLVTPISQAQANQRAGRAGRTGPGKCFRLYTETAYQLEMLPSPIPDIQRQNIANTILILKAMGINDLLRFDFMDAPPVNTTLVALEELYTLGALDDEGLLTSLGRKMTYFPMDPPLAKVLLKSIELGCSDEMITIVAMLNLTSVFYRPKEKQAQADQKKAKFHGPHGDHLTLLNVYNSWKQNGFSSTWCVENFIQIRGLKQAKSVRGQLISIVERCHFKVVSCGRETDKIRRALCAGFFRNTARREAEAGSGAYKTIIESTGVYLHPSSALFGKSAEWLVYHELVLTTREYMHWCTSIDPRWLVEEVPTFFKLSGTDGTMSKRRQQERIQPLHNKFVGEDGWRLSAQRRAGRSGGGGTWG